MSSSPWVARSQRGADIVPPDVHAREIVEALGITQLPVNPVEVLARLKIGYEERALDGCLGLTVVAPAGMTVVVSTTIQNQGRKRFTAAHELGHATMHLNRGFRCTPTDGSDGRSAPAEQDANSFASHLLMPESLVAPRFDQIEPRLDLIGQVATLCGTSLTATALRYVKRTDRRCAIVMSREGTIQWSFPSSAFGFRLSNGPLPKGTRARALSKNGSQQDDWEVSRPDDWIDEYSGQAEEIQEHSVAQSRHKQVLTMLLLDEDQDDE